MAIPVAKRVPKFRESRVSGTTSGSWLELYDVQGPDSRALRARLYALPFRKGPSRKINGRSQSACGPPEISIADEMRLPGVVTLQHGDGEIWIP